MSTGGRAVGSGVEPEETKVDDIVLVISGVGSRSVKKKAKVGTR